MTQEAKDPSSVSTAGQAAPTGSESPQTSPGAVFGNIFVFIKARYQTSANTLKDAVTLLACRPDIQKALRADLRKTKSSVTVRSATGPLAQIYHRFSKGTTTFSPTPGSHVAFAGGPRACMGKRFAKAQFCAVSAALFKDYSVESAIDDGQAAGGPPGEGVLMCLNIKGKDTSMLSQAS